MPGRPATRQIYLMEGEDSLRAFFRPKRSFNLGVINIYTLNQMKQQGALAGTSESFKVDLCRLRNEHLRPHPGNHTLKPRYILILSFYSSCVRYSGLDHS